MPLLVAPEGYGERGVKIFWDGENVQPPTGFVNPSSIPEKIKTNLQNLGYSGPIDISIFAGLKKNLHKREDFKDGARKIKKGLTLNIHYAHSDRPNAADEIQFQLWNL